MAEEQYVSLGNVLMQKQTRSRRAEPATADQQVIRQERLSIAGPGDRGQRLAMLESREEEMYADPGAHDRHTARNFNADPAARYAPCRAAQRDPGRNRETGATSRPRWPKSDGVDSRSDTAQIQAQQGPAPGGCSPRCRNRCPNIRSSRRWWRSGTEAAQIRWPRCEHNIANFEILARSQKEPVDIPPAWSSRPCRSGRTERSTSAWGCA